jgi:general secretion pathway protein C
MPDMFLKDKAAVINGHLTRFYPMIFNLVVITLCVYIGVDAFYRIARMQFAQVDVKEVEAQAEPEETPVIKSGQSDYQTIVDRNIFSKINVKAKNSDDDASALKVTILKLALIGTIAGDNKTSAAFIEDTGTKTQGLYKIGDPVQGAVVKSIARNKVTLKIGSRDEVLIMEEPGSAGGTAAAADRSQTSQPVVNNPLPGILTGAERNIALKRSEVNESLNDLNQLLSQASIQPHSTDGQADGLAVTGIKAGSIFRKMGLRNGDIVKSVNNENIKSPEDLINMYNDLRTAPDISVQIMRRGQERTLNFNFTD